MKGLRDEFTVDGGKISVEGLNKIFAK